jgi:anti-sigma B factor antagonist
MSFTIETREREGITLLDCAGRLLTGDPATALRDRISQLLTQGKLQVILNLAEVEFIDSTGLGALVICFTSARKAGGALKLLNLQEKGIELLVLAKLTSTFELFSDEQHAVNSFFPGRNVKRFDILSFVQKQKEQDT